MVQERIHAGGTGTPASDTPAPAPTEVATTGATAPAHRTAFPARVGASTLTYVIEHLDGTTETVELPAGSFTVTMPPVDVARAAGALADGESIVQDEAGRWWVLVRGEPTRLREIAGELDSATAPTAAATTAATTAPYTVAPTATTIRGAAKAEGAIVPGIAGLLADLETVSVRYVGDGTAALTTKASLDDVKKLPGVTDVTNDVLFDLGSTNDTYYGKQWSFENDGTTAQTGGYPSVAGADARIPAAWQKSTGTGQVVAVIDSGVRTDHEDLRDQLWVNPREVCGNGIDDDHNGYVDDCNGWDFGKGDNGPSPDSSQTSTFDHGTHVAGIIAAEANNGTGVAGVAPGARIMAIKVANGDALSMAGIATGIRYAADNGATVINMSLATNGTQTPRAYVSNLESAISYAVGKGVVIVAAVGNSSADLRNSNDGVVGIWPAGFASIYPQMLAVGATDPTGGRSYFSNYNGPTNIYAPGSYIMATLGGGGYGRMSGTSMASPAMAGAVAVVLASGAATPSTVVQKIRSTGRANGLDAPSLDLANAVGVAPALASVTYDGLDQLRPDAQGPIELNVASTTPVASVAVRVSVAAFADSQVMALENLDVAAADSAGTLPHRYTDGTGQLADIDVRDHGALNGAGYRLTLTTGFPAGQYALVTELIDKATNLPIGRPSAVYFQVGDGSQPPGSTVPTTPSTTTPATTTPATPPPNTTTPPNTQPPGTQPPGTQPPGTTAPPPYNTTTPPTQPPYTTAPPYNTTTPPNTQPPATPPPNTTTPPTQPPYTTAPPYNTTTPPTQPPTTQPPATQPPNTTPPPNTTTPNTTAPSNWNQWSAQAIAPSSAGIQGGDWVAIYGAFPMGTDLGVWFDDAVVTTRSYDGFSAVVRTPSRNAPGNVTVTVRFFANGTNVALTLPGTFTFTGSPSTTVPGTPPPNTTVPPYNTTTPPNTQPPATTSPTTVSPTFPPGTTSPTAPPPPVTTTPGTTAPNTTSPNTTTPLPSNPVTTTPATTVPATTTPTVPGGLGWAPGPLGRRTLTGGTALTRLNVSAFGYGRCTASSCVGTAL